MEKEANLSTAQQNPAKPGVYIKTFGCQMNEYDSLKLSKVLENNYHQVTTPEEADLILINTCSIREKAENKLYSLLGTFKELKENNQNLLIGVGGCVAQQEGVNIVKRSKNVDFVFGTHNLSLVPSLIAERVNSENRPVAVSYREDWEDYPLGFADNSDGVSAYIAISRGCNKNCTYCIVPTTRGKEVSRDPREIETEVRIAVHRGAKEVMLLGQTVNSYGRDFSPRMTFVSLLERIASIPGVERIRFTSPHPQEVRQDFIDIVCQNPKICRHVHMPLQSGSDRILRAMNRNYRRDKYLMIIDSIKTQVPDMGITTDIIVGFPGETEDDFNQTLEIMDTVRFQNSFSFVFSPRPGTPAEHMSDPIPSEVKFERLKILQEKQDKLCREELDSWIDKEVEVLIEKISSHDNECFMGRTSQNIVMNLNKTDNVIKKGDIVTAVVKESKRYTLKGDFVAFK